MDFQPALIKGIATIFDVPTGLNHDPYGVFSVDSPNGRSCQKYPDGEHPSGEWNTLDLYCFGTTGMHVVNGLPTAVFIEIYDEDKLC